MELLLFLFGVVGISLSGVIAPGPVTATTIAMGSRNRHAGALIAIGHGIVEFPLMVLIVLGADRILKSATAQIIIGLAGGAFLLIMGAQMLKASRTLDQQTADSQAKRTPILAGIVLSAGNPYFLLWWATVGLGIATTAGKLGAWAFVLFALVHWLCDLVWLWALSWASYKGSTLLSEKLQKTVLVVCALFILAFGVYFLISASLSLLSVFSPPANLSVLCNSNCPVGQG